MNVRNTCRNGSVETIEMSHHEPDWLHDAGTLKLPIFATTMALTYGLEHYPSLLLSMQMCYSDASSDLEGREVDCDLEVSI